MTYQEIQNNEVIVAISEAIYHLEKENFNLETHTRIETLKWVLSLYK